MSGNVGYNNRDIAEAIAASIATAANEQARYEQLEQETARAIAASQASALFNEQLKAAMEASSASTKAPARNDKKRKVEEIVDPTEDRLKKTIKAVYPMFRKDVRGCKDGDEAGLNALIGKVINALELAVMGEFSRDSEMVYEFALTCDCLDMNTKAEEYYVAAKALESK
ncbi:MAG TPA: hypothetical protein VN457_01435 [Chlamydiales bacterium]|nr:hypothetical protein [Chlamydiales bacterium]